MSHDACRNTRAFKFAGQNLASSGRSDNYDPVDAFLNSAIQNQWYGEVKDARQSDVDRCCNAATG